MESGRLKETLEGTGIGLVTGLVLGLVDADWIRMTIVIALIAYVGRDAGKHALRSGITGLCATLALFAGLYIHGNQLFKETPQMAVEKWMQAGFTPSEARQLYLKSIYTDTTRRNNHLRVKRIENSDTSSTDKGYAFFDDSLTKEVDSIKAILAGLLNGDNPISQGKALSGIVGLNLFSSKQTSLLCEQLDPGLFEDSAAYLDNFNNLGIKELREISVLPSENEISARYELASLLHRLICTLESDSLSPWPTLTDPITYGNNLQKLHSVYLNQERKVFPLLSTWIGTHASDPLDAFRSINAFIRRH